MAHAPEEAHVRLTLDPAQADAVRKIRNLLSDLSDALSVFVQGDLDTDAGQPDMEPDAGEVRHYGQHPLDDCGMCRWLSGQRDKGWTYRVTQLDTEDRVVRADTLSGQLDPDVRMRLSDPDADKADLSGVHPVLRQVVRADASAGQTAGQVVRDPNAGHRDDCLWCQNGTPHAYHLPDTDRAGQQVSQPDKRCLSPIPMVCTGDCPSCRPDRPGQPDN